MPWGRINLQCPTCLEEIDPERVLVVDYQGQESYTSIARSSWFRTNNRPRSRAERLEDLRAQRRLACRRKHTLPRDLLEVGVAPIALLGLSQSMKSHYVAATCYQLMREQALAELPQGRSLVFTAIEHCRDRLNIEYIDRLFTQRRAILPTEPVADPVQQEPVREPITLRAEFTTTSVYATESKRWKYVSLYDAPGEMFRTQHHQMIHAPYVADPAAVLLFVDVASLPAVRAELDQDAPEDYSPLDPQIISSAGEVMREYHDTSEPRNIPLAVIVSRADLLRTSPAFERYHKVLDDEKSGTNRGKELAREFVERYARAVPILADHSFGGQVQFFFASATGCSPDAEGFFPSVSPWGCLDPFLWVLEMIGFAR